MNKIQPCLWFDAQAEAAAEFYSDIFDKAQSLDTSPYPEASAKLGGKKPGSVMTVEFEIDGWNVTALNGGPHFKLTPATSFFVWRTSEGEVDNLWKKLSAGGSVRMELGAYPWAKKYGWVADKFGVDWQVILSDNKRGLAPAFLFVRKIFGRGEEAINFYTSQFPNSKVDMVARDEKTNTVMHSVFSLCGQEFVLMEGQGDHDFEFSPAFSFMIGCESQEEIDSYWARLSQGGAPGQCGWLTDKFGVSWQVIPRDLGKYMSQNETREDVMKALLQMKKIDVAALAAAAKM